MQTRIINIGSTCIFQPTLSFSFNAFLLLLLIIVVAFLLLLKHAVLEAAQGKRKVTGAVKMYVA